MKIEQPKLIIYIYFLLHFIVTYQSNHVAKRAHFQASKPSEHGLKHQWILDGCLFVFASNGTLKVRLVPLLLSIFHLQIARVSTRAPRNPSDNPYPPALRIIGPIKAKVPPRKLKVVVTFDVVVGVQRAPSNADGVRNLATFGICRSGIDFFDGEAATNAARGGFGGTRTRLQGRREGRGKEAK